MFELIGYADDTTLYGRLKDFARITERRCSVRATINNEIDKIRIWLAVNKLSLNASKTKMMTFFYHQRTYLQTSLTQFSDGPEVLDLEINGVPITKVSDFNFLGVMVNENLKWQSHTDMIAGKIGKNVGILHKLKHYLPRKIMMMLYNSLIQSYLNGGILLWGFEPGKLSVLQKKAVRAISFAKYNSHTTNSFRKLKILKIEDIFNARSLKFYHKLVNSKLPTYFLENFTAANHSQPRTQGASKCLKYKIFNDLQIYDPLIIDKVHTHSLDGFSTYVKEHILSRYVEECTIPNCFACREGET